MDDLPSYVKGGLAYLTWKIMVFIYMVLSDYVDGIKKRRREFKGGKLKAMNIIICSECERIFVDCITYKIRPVFVFDKKIYTIFQMVNRRIAIDVNGHIQWSGKKKVKLLCGCGSVIEFERNY